MPRQSRVFFNVFGRHPSRRAATVRASAVFLLLATTTPPVRRADAQGTDATIGGRVQDGAGTPVSAAIVTVRNASTGFTTTTRSTPTGQYAFAQLPLGGPYEVTARRLGFEAVTKTGYRLTLGAHLRVDFRLEERAASLASVVVTADTAAASRQRLGGSTRIGAQAMADLPAVGRNFTDLAALAPTVGSEFSIGGARATSTDVRIDGLQARNMLRGGELGRGPYTISMEAIREFEVVTNVYDVTQGRLGGGSISAATKAGTNQLAGSLFTYTRNEALSGPRDFLGRGRALRRSDVWQLGGSAGGPIVRDRGHYFLAFDRQQSSGPLAIADLRTTQDEVDAQIAKDSLSRFLDILTRKYGAGADGSPLVGIFSRHPVANTAFARIDWRLGDAHQLTVRNNLSTARGPNDGVGDQVLAVIESRSSSKSVDNQTLVSLRSTVAPTVQNELKLGFSLADRSLTPNTNIPRGFVRVRSTLPDGTTGDVRLQFGGNRLAPERSGERQYQLVNTLYWQRGSQLVTAGVDNSLTYLRTFIPTDEGGLFEFDSLGALDALVASRYTRQVPLGPAPYARQYVLDAGAFAQTEWRPSAAVVATLGLRYDVTSFLTAAARNALVEQRLGLRTDNTPTDWSAIQPRAQITFDPRGDGHDVIRVGAGAFTAQPHYYLQANNLFFDGTRLADLTLTGAAVPRPDFPAYRSSLAAVPDVPANVAAPAYVNLMGADFRAPVTWKGSVSYSRRLADWLSVSGTFLASETRRNYQYFDRNLRDDPAFTLDNEQGRSVFVPASTISASGRTAARFAYKHPEFTHVLELVSTGRARSRTAIIDGAVALPRGGQARGSYTFNRARDNSTFSCCIARTASLLTPVKSDPRDLSGSWGSSDFDFRHKVAAYAEMPVGWGVTLGARYVGTSGRPFSLTVNGDINGDDYASNDLAFVFDPDDPSTPPDVAAAMRRLLANDRSIARDYIRDNLGRIADRNGGSAPWTQRVDVRAARHFSTAGRQAVELIVDVYNFANLLNSRWGGQYLLPQGISASNPTTQQLPLLNVVGFDQATRRYRYTVNESVGVLRKRGDPYQVQLGLRYLF
jgi:hypothetical protein